MTTISEPRQLLSREERRESILDAAAVAFARRGFAATSMDDVAAEAGVTKLIVYRHFDSKDDLYRAVLESISTRLRDEFRRQQVDPVPGHVIRPLLDVARQEPDAVRLLWVHAAREPDFVDYVVGQHAVAVSVADEIVSEHFADEAMKKWAAETIINYLVFSVLGWLDHGDPDRDEEFIETATRGLAGMFMGWVEKPALMSDEEVARARSVLQRDHGGG